MHKGDIVIADHPDSKSRELVRLYGIVEKITKAGNVTIKMADGSKLIRQMNAIAVFIKPPQNWQELIQQQVVSCRPRKQMMKRK